MSKQRPSAPREPSSHRPGMTEPPQSVRTAMSLIWIMLAFQVIGTVIRLLAPDLFRVSGASEVAEAGDPIIGIIVSAILIGLFVWFALSFLKGARWARTTLIILTSIALIFSVFGVLTTVMFGGIPATAVTMNILQLVLLAALLQALLRPDTEAWCKP